MALIGNKVAGNKVVTSMIPGQGLRRRKKAPGQGRRRSRPEKCRTETERLATCESWGSWSHRFGTRTKSVLSRST